MSRSAPLLAALLVLAGCTAGELVGRSTSSESDVLAVQRTVDNWLNVGVASLDTTIIKSYLTPAFGSMEPAWRDRTAFLEWVLTFEESFGGPFTLSYSLSGWHTTVRGDVAWVSVTNVGMLVVEGREPRRMRFSETGVLVKQPDGRWLIDRFHSTYLGDD